MEMCARRYHETTHHLQIYKRWLKTITKADQKLGGVISAEQDAIQRRIKRLNDKLEPIEILVDNTRRGFTDSNYRPDERLQLVPAPSSSNEQVSIAPKTPRRKVTSSGTSKLTTTPNNTGLHAPSNPATQQLSEVAKLLKTATQSPNIGSYHHLQQPTILPLNYSPASPYPPSYLLSQITNVEMQHQKPFASQAAFPAVNATTFQPFPTTTKRAPCNRLNQSLENATASFPPLKYLDPPSALLGMANEPLASSQSIMSPRPVAPGDFID